MYIQICIRRRTSAFSTFSIHKIYISNILFCVPHQTMEPLCRKATILEGASNYEEWRLETRPILIKEGCWQAISRIDLDDDEVDTANDQAWATITLLCK